ncbi:hypothetical protein CL656_01140 [bacterium]|nr:hypothetical protein [bacterium]|tara:strand:- start:729 stop:2294 length:1566 start_codon:yes stop_codon:yes gene_type:complete
MKKTFLLLLFTLLFPGLAFGEDCNDGDYVLSAYYSPLPGQNYYATGSYASEIVLNGGGIITASGRYVDEIPYAFVAAPPCFEFGDVIQVENLGYFKVLDRGGAIKGKRLDVWVGYGNSGLRTALNFGKKTLFIKKVSEISDEQLKESYQGLDDSLINLPKNGVYNPLEFISNLKLGDTGFFVGVVQQFLKDLGLYKNQVSFVFDRATQSALDDFKTNFSKIKNDKLPETGLNEAFFINLRNFAIHKRQEEVEYEFLFSDISKGMENFDVLNMQKILYLLGYEIEITGKFDDQTSYAIKKFQDDNDFTFLNSSSKGYFGPKTKSVLLQNMLSSNFFSENFDVNEFFYSPVYKNQKSQIVLDLQNFLKKSGFYKSTPTGVMDDLTINSLRHFQLSAGVIDNSKTQGAGFFGPKTRRFFNKLILNINNLSFLKNRNNLSDNSSVSVESIDSLVGLKYLDNNSRVELLQTKLIEKGFLDAKYTTTYFGDKTLAALDKLKLKMQEDFSVDVDPKIIDMQIHRYLMD